MGCDTKEGSELKILWEKNLAMPNPGTPFYDRHTMFFWSVSESFSEYNIFRMKITCFGQFFKNANRVFG